MKHGQQILIAIDQLANAVFAGYADETLSSRAWRMRKRKKRWAMARRIIDGLFFWQNEHCFQAYESERLRKQLPKELRHE